jgi:hypothetical protein
MRLLQLDLELSVQCPMSVHKRRSTMEIKHVNPQYRTHKWERDFTRSVESLRIKTYRATRRLRVWVHQERVDSCLS